MVRCVSRRNHDQKVVLGDRRAVVDPIIFLARERTEDTSGASYFEPANRRLPYNTRNL